MRGPGCVGTRVYGVCEGQGVWGAECVWSWVCWDLGM